MEEMVKAEKDIWYVKASYSISKDFKVHKDHSAVNFVRAQSTLPLECKHIKQWSCLSLPLLLISMQYS